MVGCFLVGLRIIYGEAYSGFDSSLLAAKIVRPTEQLASMTERFAARSASSAKFSHWFQPAAKKTTNTRSIKLNDQHKKYQNCPEVWKSTGQNGKIRQVADSLSDQYIEYIE